MEPRDDEDIWVGEHLTCGNRFSIFASEIDPDHPGLNINDDTDEISIACPRCPGRFVTLGRLEVKLLPLSAWKLLPPTLGCSQCGTEHDDDIPHNAVSITYQYWFRIEEVRAGRPGRWPTWKDAMAHCTPDMQRQWTEALRRQGVEV